MPSNQMQSILQQFLAAALHAAETILHVTCRIVVHVMTSSDTVIPHCNLTAPHSKSFVVDCWLVSIIMIVCWNGLHCQEAKDEPIVLVQIKAQPNLIIDI